MVNPKLRFVRSFFTKSKRKFCLLLLVVFFYFLYVSNRRAIILDPSELNPYTKSILVWNSPHRMETAAFGYGGKDLFISHDCEYTNCEVQYKHHQDRLLEYYDAIIFNMHEMWMVSWPNFTRQPEQRFIWLSQESPQTLPVDFEDPRYKNFFNWTMSYRLNADIQLRYGRVMQDISELGVEKALVGIPPVAPNYAAGKKRTRPVVWMASHCDTNSLRETYVAELSKFIPVDIYGGCGGNNSLYCPQIQQHWLSSPHCYEELASKYKFYLAFENSFCVILKM